MFKRETQRKALNREIRKPAKQRVGQETRQKTKGVTNPPNSTSGGEDKKSPRTQRKKETKDRRQRFEVGKGGYFLLMIFIKIRYGFAYLCLQEFDAGALTRVLHCQLGFVDVHKQYRSVQRL